MKKKLSISQKEAVEFSLQSLYYNNQVFIDMETGFGKTLTAINIIKEMDPKKMLYVCPVGLVPQVTKVFQEHLPKLKIDFKAYGWFQNLELVKTQINFAKEYDLVILDEAHKIKSYSSSILAQAEQPLDYFTELKNVSREKFPYTLVSIGTLAFVSQIPYRIFMTGTAMPLGAIDIFNYLWLMKHKKFITNVHSRQESYFNFAEKYSIKKSTPNGVSYSGFRKATYDLLLENLSDCYIRLEHKDEKSKDLKIPNPEYYPIEFDEMSEALLEEERIVTILQKHYNINSENMFSVLKSTPQFKQLMTLRRAVGISKIKNVLSYDKKVGKKAIYFFQFKEAAQIFYRELSKKHRHCYLVTGEMSAKKTAKLISEVNDFPECIIVATMGKAGTGFDCYGFNTIAFVELDMNYALVEQARGRILRKGIKFTPRIFFFLAKGGVDKMVISNLIGKNFKHLKNK